MSKNVLVKWYNIKSHSLYKLLTLALAQPAVFLKHRCIQKILARGGSVKLFVQSTFICSPSLVLTWNKHKGLHLHWQSPSEIYDLPKIRRNISANVPSRTDVELLKKLPWKVACNWQMQGGKNWTLVARISPCTHSLLKSKPNKCKWSDS